MTKVNPSKCFPLIVDRDVYDGGVAKMVRILSGLYADGTGNANGNLCAGYGYPYAFKVTEQYRPHLRRHLIDMGLSKDEVDKEMEDSDSWYGIIDGNYRLAALIYLRKTLPDV